MSEEAPVLSVKGLRASYGRVVVVSDVSFDVYSGEWVSLVGRNGAGKTTSLMAISGLRYGPGGGDVAVGGVDISRYNSHRIVAAGLKLVPEGRRLFREMSVWENLRLGAFVHRRGARNDIDTDLDRVCELFPVLRRDRDKPVGALSGGQQQMVAVGQALMTRPKVLLLDEPASGLAPALVDDLYDSFRALCDEHIGLLVVDQSIERAMHHSDRYYVVEDGRIVLGGKCETAALDEVTRIVLGSGVTEPGAAAPLSPSAT